MASSLTPIPHSMIVAIANPGPVKPSRQIAPPTPDWSYSLDSTVTDDYFKGDQPTQYRITDSLASYYNANRAFLPWTRVDTRSGASSKVSRREDLTLRRASTQVLPNNANSHAKVIQYPDNEAYSSDASSTYDIKPTRRRFALGRSEKDATVLSEWIGTSPFSTAEGLAIQKCASDDYSYPSVPMGSLYCTYKILQGLLESLIDYRKAILHDITLAPYHPCFYIELSKVDNKLGFGDIGAANAYRALVLIKAGLGITDKTFPKILGQEVRSSCVKLGKGEITFLVIDELEELHLNALRELLRNLLDSGALWEGLWEAKEALKLFPRDVDLIEIRNLLKDGFEGKCRVIPNDTEDVEITEAVVAYTRRGSIYQKTYPWLDKALYIRSPALVDEVNKNFAALNCEVRQVTFRELTTHAKMATKNEDVGPLGIFATKDIREGDLIMVDCCFTSMSDVPSSQLDYCDACHASVFEPYMLSGDVIKPRCCGKVAYCSTECYEVASNGYHRIACGKDFDWLYKDTNNEYSKKAARERWRSILFFRIICLILSGRRTERQSGEEPTHPLQHPLVVRMAANYAPKSKLHPDDCSGWAYLDNVVTPHRILQQLNVDVFKSPEFTPEVIQTIYWRIENNASQSTVDFSKENRFDTSFYRATKRRQDDEQNIHLVCLNPNYIFFNHSCEPNVDWHGSSPNPWVGSSWLRGMDKDLIQPGCSAVWCNAARDIKKGEELKISYVGDPTGKEGQDRPAKRYMMEKWFEGGCGCNICLLENQTGEIGREVGEEDDTNKYESGYEAGSEEGGGEDNEDREDSEDSEIEDLIARMRRFS